MTTGAERIAAERAAHVTREGWTPEHDAQHAHGELALAASCYAEHASDFVEKFGNPADWDELTCADYRAAGAPIFWPWDDKWWKPKNPERDLERAGALCAAELDRLSRNAS